MEDIFIFIRQDEEYSGYFYLKDTVLNPNKDNLSIQLQNDSGIIEIKFRNESKFKSWEKCLRERINEMTESNQEREEILEDKVITIDKEEINFGVECIFKSVNLILIHENNFDNLFQLSVNTLILSILIRSDDIEMNLSIDGVKLYDLQQKINEMKKIKIQNY